MRMALTSEMAEGISPKKLRGPIPIRPSILIIALPPAPHFAPASFPLWFLLRWLEHIRHHFLERSGMCGISLAFVVRFGLSCCLLIQSSSVHLYRRSAWCPRFAPRFFGALTWATLPSASGLGHRRRGFPLLRVLASCDTNYLRHFAHASRRSTFCSWPPLPPKPNTAACNAS